EGRKKRKVDARRVAEERQREEERKAAQLAAAEARRQQELERRRREAEEQGKHEEVAREARRELEARRQRAAAAGKPLPITVPGETVRSEAPSAVPAPTYDTIKAPPPEKFTTDQLSARETLRPEVPHVSRGRNRIAILAATVVLMILGGAFMVWKLTRSQNQTGQPNQPAKETVQPNQSVNQPNTGPPENKAVAPSGMVYVPGGQFMMGRNDADELKRPAHKVTVNPFL